MSPIVRLADLPSFKYPGMPGFLVRTGDGQGGVTLCPSHADMYVASGEAVRVEPQSPREWRAWLDATTTVNGCYQCNVDAGGRVV